MTNLPQMGVGAPAVAQASTWITNQSLMEERMQKIHFRIQWKTHITTALFSAVLGTLMLHLLPVCITNVFLQTYLPRETLEAIMMRTRKWPLFQMYSTNVSLHITPLRETVRTQRTLILLLAVVHSSNVPLHFVA